ncbi:MAG: hypothetical protein ACREGI_04055 [Candidatus Levyibacteriota bacterium]
METREKIIEKIMKKLIVFALCIVGSLFFAYKIFAQQTAGLNITISPTILDLATDPGTTISQSFRIRNNGDQAITLHISLDKLNPDSSTGQVLPINPMPGDTSMSWVQFEKNDVTAAPKEWTTVKFSINVPKDAAFGYYYAIRIGQGSVAVKTNAKVLGEVILPLLLNVKKDGAKAQMHLISFSTPFYVNEVLPIVFNTVLGNNGNVHLKPTGNIFISQGNTTVGIIDINQALGNVLPQGTRLFQSSWDEGFLVSEPVMEDNMVKLDSNNHPVTHLVINWNKLTSFRIGKYNAHALLVYDDGEKDVTLEATTTFWVLPWKFLLGCVLILILLIVLIRFVLKWYIAKEVRKYRNQG